MRRRVAESKSQRFHLADHVVAVDSASAGATGQARPRGVVAATDQPAGRAGRSAVRSAVPTNSRSRTPQGETALEPFAVRRGFQQSGCGSVTGR